LQVLSHYVQLVLSFPRREVIGESLDPNVFPEVVLTLFLLFPVVSCVFDIIGKFIKFGYGEKEPGHLIKFEPYGFGDVIAALFALLLSIWLANIFATLIIRFVSTYGWETTFMIGIVIFIIIASVWIILGVRRALKNSPISRLFLLILFLSTTIWFATLEKAEGGSIESILGVSLAGGFVIWLLPALFLSLYQHGFRGEDLEDDFYKVWYIDIRRMDKLPGCYKCKKDRGKCVCSPAPQKLSKKEQRRMDLMANVAIEELLGKTSSRSCSNGTGFWGVGKCTGTPVHACKRCSTYVCSMHVSKRTTYKGAYVCATCDSNMSD